MATTEFDAERSGGDMFSPDPSRWTDADWKRLATVYTDRRKSLRTPAGHEMFQHDIPLLGGPSSAVVQRIESGRPEVLRRVRDESWQKLEFVLGFQPGSYQLVLDGEAPVPAVALRSQLTAGEVRQFPPSHDPVEQAIAQARQEIDHMDFVTPSVREGMKEVLDIALMGAAQGVIARIQELRRPSSFTHVSRRTATRRPGRQRAVGE